ncbi:MAG: HlyD family efflux transporter periplasmic adaptor subunit [Pseudomonadota bacterium]
MLKALKGRFVLKLAVLIVIVAIPAAFAWFAVQGFVVRNAVVTAELGIVRAPIAGQIVESPPSIDIARDDHPRQVTLRDPLSDRAPIDMLTAEIEGVSRAIETHQSNLDWHDQLIEEREDELRSALAGMRLVLQFEHDAITSQIAAQQARIADLESRDGLEEITAELAEASANLESLQSRALLIEQQRLLLSQRLPVADFAGLGVTLIDHLNDLAIARQSAAIHLAALENARLELQMRLESEQQAFELRSEAVLTAPPTSVIWEVFAEPGAFVALGSPLFSFVDCDRRLVQVAVDDATTELLSPGQAVEVHLYGDRATVPGRVRGVYGSGGQATERASLAASLSGIGPRDAIVLIDIEPADERSRQYRHCDIGRTAYVTFDGIGAFEPFFNRF